MKEIDHHFDATGTVWHITINVRDSHRAYADEFLAMEKLVAAFEKTFSRFRDDSLVSRIAGQMGNFFVGKDFVNLLTIYQKFYDATDQAFTPLMGDALVAAGYDKKYSFEKRGAGVVQNFANAVKIIDAENITIVQPVHFDFGGAGKGFVIDLLTTFLQTKKYREFTINAGGDVRHYSESAKSDSAQKLVIALEHPQKSTHAIGTIDIGNGSLCASSAVKRQWAEGQHHIINPRTSESMCDVMATWALARDAAIADGCATSLFFVAPEKLEAFFTFDYVVLRSDGSVVFSDAFKDQLFL